MNDPIVEFEKFKVRVSEVNSKKELTVPSMINLMQEAAWNNAGRLGFSVYDLHGMGITWILHRMQLKINDMAFHGDNITVETWPSGMDKYYVFRDFKVHGQNGLLATAASNWLVFDIKERKLISVPGYLSENVPTANNDHLPRVTGKLQKINNVDSSVDIKVGWHQLDPNQHTNNLYYFIWILESLPEFTFHMNLRSVDIIFKSESQHGDLLECQVQQVEDCRFLHSILNKKQGQQVIQAETIWE